jgi:hypothetical protein
MRLGDRILMSRINCLTSSGTFGRPPRGRDFHRQYKRKPARCQRITVSGLTIAKALSTSGAKPYSPTNTIRSMLPRIGRLSDLRRRILSWCRSARISISSEARDRNNPISPHEISLQSSIIRQKFHPIRGSSPVVLGLRQGHRGKPAIHLNEEPAIVVRKVGSASDLPLQNDQLMSKYRIKTRHAS